MTAVKELEQKLQYTFRDPSLLEQALCHSSFANEHRARNMRSNERLEFLGDSILGLVTAEFLYRQRPDWPEGELTRSRAALVCEKSLYGIALELGLGEHLHLGRGEESGGGRNRPSILADAVEAVLAAPFDRLVDRREPPAVHGQRVALHRPQAVVEREADEVEAPFGDKAEVLLLVRLDARGVEAAEVGKVEAAPSAGRAGTGPGRGGKGKGCHGK